MILQIRKQNERAESKSDYTSRLYIQIRQRSMPNSIRITIRVYIEMCNSLEKVFNSGVKYREYNIKAEYATNSVIMKQSVRCRCAME